MFKRLILIIIIFASSCFSECIRDRMDSLYNVYNLISVSKFKTWGEYNDNKIVAKAAKKEADSLKEYFIRPFIEYNIKNERKIKRIDIGRKIVGSTGVVVGLWGIISAIKDANTVIYKEEDKHTFTYGDGVDGLKKGEVHKVGWQRSIIEYASLSTVLALCGAITIYF